MPNVKRRTYDSTRRKAQADQTRRDIIDAAWTVFAESGYAGTTLPAIANEAEVAVVTIYRVFGDKAGLLEQVILAAVHRGAEEAGQLTVADIEAVGPRAWCMAAGSIHPGVHGTSGALMRALREGSKADPTLREVWESIEGKRLAGIRRDAEALVASGATRASLTVDQITDLTWALTSIDNYDHLVGERGWSPDEYGAWLGDAFQRLFLDSGESG